MAHPSCGTMLVEIIPTEKNKCVLLKTHKLSAEAVEILSRM
jgi:hypothetical protein